MLVTGEQAGVAFDTCSRDPYVIRRNRFLPLTQEVKQLTMHQLLPSPPTIPGSTYNELNHACINTRKVLTKAKSGEMKPENQ
jgi:hypothetical protein